MDENRRKLPSWMLGIKKIQDNNSNDCQKEEGNGKRGKIGKRVVEKKRKNDEFEVELSDGGDRRRIRRKGNGDHGCVESSDDESRKGKKKGRGINHNVKDNVKGKIVNNGFESDEDFGFDGDDRGKGGGDDRKGKKRDRGISHNVKGKIVDNGFDRELSDEDEDVGFDGYGDEGCVENSDGSRKRKKRDRGIGLVDVRLHDGFEEEYGDVDERCDGGSRGVRRKGYGDFGCDEDSDESREGKKKGGGFRGNVKSRIVDDMVDDGIGYGKRRNSVKVRKAKLGSDDYDCDDVDDDDGILYGKGNKGGRNRKRRGMIDAAESKKLELEEEDDSEDTDGGGGQVVLRKCKGKRRADRGKLVGNAEDLALEDEDLIVEDLVSIAEEYVNKYMEAAQELSQPEGISSVDNLMRVRKEHTIEGEDIGETHTSETSINVNTHSLGSLNNKLLNGEEARRHSLLNENVTVMKPIMSGDPAQDMLDLFLGHLLKKPREEANKMDISLAVQRQEPVDPPVDAVPYTKKKSSLKDKVAMFFD